MDSIAKEDICTDRSGKIVPRNDPTCAFVLVGKGRAIPTAIMARYRDALSGQTEKSPAPELPKTENTKIKKRQKRVIKPDATR
jgi:hypothetical protein